MQKTLTLYPSYITANSGFSEILRNSGAEYAEKEIPAEGSVHVGTIAFDNSTLRSLSTACLINEYRIDYDQRVRIATGKPKIWWRSTGWQITGYTLSGQTLTVKNKTVLGGQIASPTSGDNWKPNGGVLYSGSLVGATGGTDLLGFDLYGTSDASFSYRLRMKNLRSTVTYTARYNAIFCDDNGGVIETKVVNGGEKATAPNIEREGYTVYWSCDGKAGAFAGDNLPTSEDKDLVFRAIYNRIPKVLSVDEPTKGSATVYLYSDGWQEQQKPSVSDGKRYYTFYYGYRVKIVADGCNKTSEDLIVTQKDPFSGDIISTETIDGGDSTTLDVLDVVLKSNVNVSITPRTHNYIISTQAGDGGTITATHNAARHSNDSVIITPAFGYEIETVTIDGDTQEVGDREPLTVDFTDVTAPHSVAATFALIKIPIYFDLPEGVTVEGDSEVYFFSDSEWTFDCGENASFTSLKLDGRELLDVPVFKQISSFSKEVTGITTPITFKADITDDLATVTIQQTAGGTVTCDKMTSDTQKFVSGVGSLTFKETPNDYKQFVKWFNDSVSETITLDVDGDLTVSAVFDDADVQVEVSFSPENGKIIVKTPGANYGKDITECHFKVGESVDYEIVPDAGNDFRAVDSTIVVYDGTEGVYPFPEPIYNTKGQFTVDNVVKFNIKSYRLNYQIVAAPELIFPVADHTVTVDPSGAHYYGDTVTIRAIPAKHWHFVEWRWHENHNIPDEAKYSSIITGYAQDLGIAGSAAVSTDFEARFAQDFYDITVETGEGGKVTGGGKVVESGDTLLEITADYGYKVSDVLLDGNSVFDSVTLTRRGGTYLLQNVTSPHTVEVKFEKRIYTNGRKLLDYYPPVIASIREIEKLMEVLQVTDDALWDSVSFVMENQFIDTATAEGVTMWERELGIVASPTETLTQRKARLRLKWVPNNRFTMKWLHEWLEDVCGTSIRKPVVHEKGDYILTVALPWFVQWVEVFKDLEKYKPANIELDPTVTLPSKDIKLLTGFAMRTHTKYTVYAGEED